MKRFGLAVLVLTAGCASAPLNQQEQAVRILRKSDAPATCRELGKVTAPGLASLSDEGREKDLKRNAAKLGGDTVTWDRQDENMTIFGTAFACGTTAQTAR
jgi:hypothetical protein